MSHPTLEKHPARLDEKSAAAGGRRCAGSESEHLLEKIFSNIHVHIAYLDSAFNFIRVNRNYAAADGREPDFFVGKNHFALYPDAENEAIFRRVVATGEPYVAYERAFQYAEHPERGVTYWDWSLEPVMGAQGAVEGVVLSLIDVTQRRRSEASLAEAQRIAHLGNWDWDIESGALHWSDEIYRIFGLVPRQFSPTYAAFVERIHPEDRARVQEAVDAALQRKAPYGIDHRIVQPDGRVRDVHEQAEVSFDAAGRPVRMLGTVQDITAQKQAERALRRLNRSLRTLSHGNQALVHAQDEGELLREMCRILTEVGEYRLAWVGYAEQNAQSTLRVAAQAGLAPDIDPRELMRWAGRGGDPGERTLRSGAPEVERELERRAGEQGGAVPCNALLALPLHVGDRVLGVLVIGSLESNAFDAEESRLLSEMAEDLAYGIATLRTRRDREQALSRLHKSMEGTIQAVASTIEMRDPYTAGHQRRVALLAAAMARELGLSEDEVTGIHMMGMVHDIGKIYVPAEILNRPGPLNAAEVTLVRTHPQVGYDILKGVELPWPVAEAVLQHHERLDGSGYPGGLQGEAIVPGARILAVADTVEAMASHRPYRPGLGVERALNEISRNRGTLYDPAAVDACLVLFQRKGFGFGRDGEI